MCECYKVGGRFIAEDPDCPVHGYQAQREESSRYDRKEQFREDIRNAETFEDLRSILSEMLELI
jgi:hypothetical protein